MSFPIIRPNFAGGEISPKLWGHIDAAKVQIGMSTARNLYVDFKGGASSRAGTKFVGYSGQTGRAYPPRLITFQFSINQGLTLEFGNEYMRVIQDGAFVLDPATNISGITNANPAVVTDVAHGYITQTAVFISGVSGMTEINGQTFVIVVIDADHFSLHDWFGNNIDSTTFGVYAGGGTAASLFTLRTPWGEADLKWLKFTQSADVMSICCWNQDTGTLYPPYDLARLANNNWTVTPFSAGASIQPTFGTGSASGPGTTDYKYQLTCISRADGSESVGGPIIDIPNAVDIAATAGTVTFSLQPKADALYYNVYKALATFDSTVPPGAEYGYAGFTFGAEFVDTNIVPDMTRQPPLHKDPFAPGAIISIEVTNPGMGITAVTGFTTTGAGTGLAGYPAIVAGQMLAFVVTNGGTGYHPGDTIAFTVNAGGTPPSATLHVGPETGTYPSVVNYFQERRVYASTPDSPDTYFMSQPGLFFNFDSRIPTIDSDAIVGTPWSVEVNGIQFMVSMPGGLVALTGLSAWQLTGTGGSSLNPQPITPASQQAQPQAYNGCSAYLPPIKIDYDIIYLQAKGSVFRDLSYNFFTNIYTGTDITFLSSQLFEGHTMREAAWCEEPYKLIWVARDDGIFLSLTYLKSQDVLAWTRHDTQGKVVSVTSVTEPPVDALYLAVERFL